MLTFRRDFGSLYILQIVCYLANKQKLEVEFLFAAFEQGKNPAP